MEIPHNVYRMNDFVTNNMFDVKKVQAKTGRLYDVVKRLYREIQFL